jgi:hypothetical protein
MEGHLERGIGLARGCGDEVRRQVEPVEVDAKMRQLILKPNRQQPMRPLPHRLGAQ